MMALPGWPLLEDRDAAGELHLVRRRDIDAFVWEIETPAICRKSDAHATVVTAFETGVLEELSATVTRCRSAARHEQLVAQVPAQVTT